MTSSCIDPRRAWLDDMLARPHLWPHLELQVQALAQELGVEVVIVDKPLNGGDWKPRGR